MHIHFHRAYESDLISPGICIVQRLWLIGRIWIWNLMSMLLTWDKGL